MSAVAGRGTPVADSPVTTDSGQRTADSGQRTADSSLPSHAPSRISDYLQLTKPRITLLVVISALVGYLAGAPPGAVEPLLLANTLFGTSLVAAAAAAFNQLIERQTDAEMRRTADRPLPAGRIEPDAAALFAFGLFTAGSAWLAGLVNPLAAFVGAFTTASYILLYTPLKRVTTLATVIGAVPGALPPMIGWAAARGRLDVEAWVLFGIMFLWQMPHFLAIAALWRADYARAGMRVLPVVEPDGASTGRQAFLYALALMPVSLLPALLGMAGPVYFAGALALGLAFLAATIRFASRPAEPGRARAVFRLSLLYLPGLWLLLVVG